MSVATPQKFYKPLAIAAALVFVYFTVLVKLGRDWWSDENYSHGLLIPFIIVFIIWQERKRFTEQQTTVAIWTAGSLVGASLFALWAGTAGAELFVQRASLVVMLIGISIYFFGFRIMRTVAVPLLLLALAIPIPQIIFNRIAFPLQLFASKCAVSAMSFFEIPVLRQGNVIELMPLGAKEPKRLAVVEACSGIRSLMTLVTLAVVYAYFTRPKSPTSPTNFSLSSPGRKNPPPISDKLKFVGQFAFWRSVILVAAAVPIAILTNAARVSGTGVLAHYYGTKVADGFFHSFSGWVIYLVAAGLLFATGWMIDKTPRLFKGSGATRLRSQPDLSGKKPTLNEVRS
ncbi:MAG TPA: exosortase/archaeosortase family protein [Pyrinomonadaceae bacterium]|jgi:exosortase